MEIHLVSRVYSMILINLSLNALLSSKIGFFEILQI